MWADEEGEPDNEEDFDQPASGTKKRKLKATTVGRVPKGQDFWSILDKWFSGKLEALGKKMTGAKWKESVFNHFLSGLDSLFVYRFIEECRRLDEAGFNQTAVPDEAATSTVQDAVSGSGGASWPRFTLCLRI